MTDSQDYRKYLESKFGDIDDHFGDLKEALKGINDHLAKLNSKVAEHEKYIVYANGVIETRKKETEVIVERLDKIDNCMEHNNDDMMEYRFFKKYPKIAIGVLLIAIVGMFLFFFDTRDQLRGLKTEVDLINTPMVFRGGAIHAPSLDSLANE